MYRHRRTRPTAILLLPEDMLVHIFLFCATSGAGMHPLLWVRTVAHICSFWRAVALRTPALWTDLDFRWPTSALAMFARSANRPVRVRFEPVQALGHYIGGAPADALRRVLSQPARIAEVLIRSQPNVLDAALHGFLGTAPWLTRLGLMQSGLPSDSPPRTLASLRAPRLQELLLDNVDMRWTWPILRCSSLRKLIIIRPSSPNAVAAPPAADVFNALAHLTSLQYLRWQNGLPEDTLTNLLHPRSPQSTILPSLRRLQAEGSAPGCLTLLRALSPVADLTVKLSTHSRFGDADAGVYERLWQAAMPYWYRGGAPSTIHMDFLANLSLHIGGVHQCTTNAPLTLRFAAPQPALFGLVGRRLAELPCRTLAVCVEGVTDFRFDRGAFYGGMRRIKRLVIANAAALNVLLTQPMLKGDPGTVPLPNLGTLVISREGMVVREDWVEILLDQLKWRVRNTPQGVRRIDKLWLRDMYGIREADARALATVVQDVRSIDPGRPLSEIF